MCRLNSLYPSRGRGGVSSNGGLAHGPRGLLIGVRSVRPSVRFQRSGQSTSFVGKLSRRRSSSHFVGRKRLLRALFSTVRAGSSVRPTVRRLVFRKVVNDGRTRRQVHSLAMGTFSLPRMRR